MVWDCIRINNYKQNPQPLGLEGRAGEAPARYLTLLLPFLSCETLARPFLPWSSVSPLGLPSAPQSAQGGLRAFAPAFFLCLECSTLSPRFFPLVHPSSPFTTQGQRLPQPPQPDQTAPGHSLSLENPAVMSHWVMTLQGDGPSLPQAVNAPLGHRSCSPRVPRVLPKAWYTVAACHQNE